MNANDQPERDRQGADELRSALRQHANRTVPSADLVSGALSRARRVRRRRTVSGAVAVVAAVAVITAGISGLQGWWPHQQLPVAESPHPTAWPSITAPQSSPSAARTTSATGEISASDRVTSSAQPRTSSPEQPTGTASRLESSYGAPLCTFPVTGVAVEPTQGAAGHVEYTITVTNNSSRPCVVAGLPGVSMVSDEGRQVGASATFDRSVPWEPVTLRPGGSAKASLWLAQADNYGTECRAVEAYGLRIYIPEETRAHVVPLRVQGCANVEIELMRVRAFTAT